MLDTRKDLFRENKQREYRQLDFMLKSLDHYKHKRILLGELVDYIEGLINSLHECNEEYKNELRSYWGRLEIEYSFLVVHKKTHLSKEEQTLVDDAIHNLEKLVQEKIKLYEPYLEDAEYE